MRRLARVGMAAATVCVAAACEVEDERGVLGPSVDQPAIVVMDPPTATVEPGTVTRFSTWGGGVGRTPLAPSTCVAATPAVASVKVSGSGCETTALSVGTTVVTATMPTGASVAVQLIVR